MRERNFDVLRGKNVAIITNQTGIDSMFRLSVDILRNERSLKLAAILAPEHGFLGGVQGEIKDSKDSKTNIPVFSLYGSSRTIPDDKIKNIDVIVFDIQDIGSRSYTYISTLKIAMEAAAKNKKEFVVLDRPNPINGIIVDGPILNENFKSFVGIAEIPYVHGMTVGELALLFNDESKIKCNLTVIPMNGWKRSMSWQDTGLPWVPTSPHIPEPDTPYYYPITGPIGELSIVNIGVGYTLPFKIVGAPWIDAEKFANELNKKNLDEVIFHPFYFKPYYGIFKDEFCKGVRIVISDRNSFKPFEICIAIMDTLIKQYPERFNFSLVKDRTKTFDNVCGTDTIRKDLISGSTDKTIINKYKRDLAKFIEKRTKYLLYD
ncbi:MAG TPA: DUF1343 domain-containing protein [bacterium]|nr:DUF1343 domain-containing protein [bacterium]